MSKENILHHLHEIPLFLSMLAALGSIITFARVMLKDVRDWLTGRERTTSTILWTPGGHELQRDRGE